MRILLLLAALTCAAQTHMTPVDVARAIAPSFPGPCQMKDSAVEASVQCGSLRAPLTVTISQLAVADLAALIAERQRAAVELAAMAAREAAENPRASASATAVLARLGRQDKTQGGRLLFYTLMPTDNGGGEQGVMVIDHGKSAVLTLTQTMVAGVANDVVYSRLTIAAGRVERLVWR